MKKLLLLLILNILFNINLFSQFQTQRKVEVKKQQNNPQKDEIEALQLYRRAQIFASRNQDLQASELARKIIDDYPVTSFYRPARRLIIDYYYKSKDYFQTRDLIDNYLLDFKDDNQNPLLMVMLLECYRNLEEYDRLFVYGEQFKKLVSGNLILIAKMDFEIALGHIELDETEKGISLIEDIYFNKKYMEIENELFNLYKKLNLIEKGKTQFKHYTKNDKSELLTLGMARFYEFIEEFDNAISVFEKLLNVPNSVYKKNGNFLFRLGKLHFQNKNPNKALEYFEKSIPFHSDPFSVSSEIIRIHLNTGQSNKSSPLLNALWEKNINNSQKAIRIIELFSEAQLYKEAIIKIDEARKKYRNPMWEYERKATILDLSGNLKGALKEYLDYIKTFKHSYHQIFERIQSYFLKNEEYEKSVLNIFENFKKQTVYKINSTKVLRDLHFQKGNIEKSISYSFEISELQNDGGAEALVNIKNAGKSGYIRASLNAIELYQKKWKTEPYFEESLFFKYELLLKDKNIKDAETILNYLIENYSTGTKKNIYKLEKIKIHLNQKNITTEIFDSLNELINSKDPNVFNSARLILGIANMKSGNFDESIKIFEYLKNFNETREESLFHLILCYYYSKKTDEAQNSSKEFYTEYPAHKLSNDVMEISFTIKNISNNKEEFEKFLEFEKLYFFNDFENLIKSSEITEFKNPQLNAKVQLLVANSLIKLNKIDESLKLLDQIRNNYKDTDEGLTAQLLIPDLLFSKSPKDSLKEWKKAVTDYPYSIENFKLRKILNYHGGEQ